MLGCDLFDGAVCGAFNHGFEPMMDHIEAWKTGDLKKAHEIWNKRGLAELQEYVYGIPQGEDVGRHHLKYKLGAWLRGLFTNPYLRPPAPKPRKEEIETMYKLLKRPESLLLKNRGSKRESKPLREQIFNYKVTLLARMRLSNFAPGKTSLFGKLNSGRAFSHKDLNISFNFGGSRYEG
jgi:hypothetical protein